MSEEIQLPPRPSQVLDGDVLKPFEWSDVRGAMEANAQQGYENAETSTQQDTAPIRQLSNGESSRGVSEPHLPPSVRNGALNGSANSTIVALKGHKRARSDESANKSTRVMSKETATIMNYGIAHTSPNTDLRPRLAHTFALGSGSHGGNAAGNIKADRTVNNEMRPIQETKPISSSTPRQKSTQGLEATSERQQTDKLGPSSGSHKDGIILDNGKLVAEEETNSKEPRIFEETQTGRESTPADTSEKPSRTVEDKDNDSYASAGSLDVEPSPQPQNSVSEAPTGSRLSSADPVTGEPEGEVSQIKKMSRYFSLHRNPTLLEYFRSKTKAKETHPSINIMGRSSNTVVVELDGLKIARKMQCSVKDIQNFEKHISGKLETLICAIPPHGSEEENSSSQELQMIAKEDGKFIPYIVIACASRRRKADVKTKLRSDLKYFELYNLPWEVIYDPEWFGPLGPSVSNGILFPTEMRDCFATTTLDEDSETNNWDKYAATRLYLFLRSAKGEVVDTSSPLAVCTLGGFVEVAGEIYGLTVAHPLLGGIRMSSAQTLRDEIATGFMVGNIIACVLSNVSSADCSAEERQDPTPPNSDWALIDLSDKFDRTQLERSQVAAKFAAVEKEKLVIAEDADLVPRKIIIRTGMSDIVKGRLSIARSRLQLGSNRFIVMRIVLDEPLVPGDSGGFVLLDGKVCGTIIAGRDSLKYAYMIPITDTFESISSEFGGALVRFPGDGARGPVEETSPLPEQETIHGEITSPEQKTTADNFMEGNFSGPRFSTLAKPELSGYTAGSSISMPQDLNKMHGEELQLTQLPLHVTSLEPKIRTPPKENRNMGPQEASSAYLPPSYALVNSPPSMREIRLGSVIPDIRNPLIDAQGGVLLDNLGDQVRSVEDLDFKMTTRSDSNDPTSSLLSRLFAKHLESHDIALRARVRAKHELLQPVEVFQKFGANLFTIRKRYGKKLYFTTGLVSLVDANWIIAKKESKVTTSYSVAANVAGIHAGHDRQFESKGAEEQLAFVSSGDRVLAVEYREIKFPRLGRGEPELDTHTKWQLLAVDFGSKG